MTRDLARAALPALVCTMSAGAWLLMWRLGDSPWGHRLHGHAGVGAPAAALGSGALFVGGWVVMTTAMMLPTTIPLLEMFRRLTAGRADRSWLAASVVAGYLAAWTVCGVLVFAAATALPALVPAAWVTPRTLAAGLFVTAGAFQFSSLKYACLERCRSPLSFLSSRWRGGRDGWHSFRLGVEHGAFCVGCCWALMLLMFAFGAVQLAWMLALAAVMAIEKNMPWGRRLSAPLGITLLLTGAAIALA